MQLKIVTDIKTDIFYAVIRFLRENNWEIVVEYDENIFDKGIDFDFYQLCKKDAIIMLAWNNWFEGEMKAAATTLNEIAEHFGIALTFGEPEYLHRENLIEEMKSLLKFNR